MRFVMKFGGTSVADAATVRTVVEIVSGYRREGHEIAVVVSAQRGVTDQLIAIAAEVAGNRTTPAIDPFISSLRLRHTSVLSEVGADFTA